MRLSLLIGRLLSTSALAYRVGEEKSRFPSTPTTRRSIVGQCISSAVMPLSLPALTRASPLPLESSSGIIRVEEVGGGLDLLSPELSSSEVFFPNSMIGSKWKVQRTLKSIEGDLGQARLMWGLLGGPDERAFTSKLTEVYDVDFLKAPQGLEGSTYTYDGQQLGSAILDRRSELASRLHIRPDDITWTDLGTIQYSKPPNNEQVSLTAVKRKSEPISEEGFGSDEIFRVSSSAGGIFGGASVYRAARLRRRFRRGFDESTGRRVLDGIEIVTTHRVLDGVAGMELPTSSTKSILRLKQI